MENLEPEKKNSQPDLIVFTAAACCNLAIKGNSAENQYLGEQVAENTGVAALCSCSLWAGGPIVAQGLAFPGAKRFGISLC